MRLFGQVALDICDLKASPAEADMAIGAQEIERSLRDFDEGELRRVCRIGRNDVDAQYVSKFSQRFRTDRLPDHEQVEFRVVEMLEKILDGAVRFKLEPHPREALTRRWRILGQ